MKKKRKKESGQPLDLVVLAEMGLLPELVEQYVLDCIKRSMSEKRKKRILPNVAGFCRFCGVGRDELEALQTAFPGEYGALISIFEDEALNSDMSSSTLDFYMKNFLGYHGEKKKVEMSICFEHDVLEDGK